MKWGDAGSWGYLAFPVPARRACLLVPNELLDDFNERTESIIIIISKGKRGSKQLCALAGFTLDAPFDQRRQRGFLGAHARTHTHQPLLVSTMHPSCSLDSCGRMRIHTHYHDKMINTQTTICSHMRDTICTGDGEKRELWSGSKMQSNTKGQSDSDSERGWNKGDGLTTNRAALEEHSKTKGKGYDS